MGLPGWKRKAPFTKTATSKDVFEINKNSNASRRHSSINSQKKNEPLISEQEEPQDSLADFCNEYPIFIFHPYEPVRLRWDMTVMAIMLYVLLDIPVRICFSIDLHPNHPWEILNLMVDIFFMIDIVFAFHTGFIRESQFITDKSEIAKRYLSGWFWIDLITSIPFGRIAAALPDSSSTNSSLAMLPRLLRFMKIARMFKLLRVLKLVKMMSNWEDQDSGSAASLRLLKFLGDSYSMGVGSPGLSNKGLSRYLMEISKARLKHLDQQDRLISQVRKLAIYNQKKKELEEELGREVSDAEWAKKVNLHEVDLRVDLTRFHNSRAALISSNLSLVTAIAKSYQNRGLNYHDLIQEGNMGLIHAAEKYEPEKGVKFATYAVLWIKQRIMRALAQHSRLIRIPVHVHEKMVILKRETGRLQEELGREPLPEEVARRLNLTPEKLRHYVKSVEVPLSLELAAFAGSATRARSAATLADRAAHGEAGDDDLYGGGGGLGAGDFPAHLGLDLVGWGQAGGLEAGEGGGCGGAAAARAEAALLRDAVARLLASELSPREREVLLARYGLEGAPSSPTGAGGPAGGGGRRPAQAGRPASAAEVSKRFNVSVGKIRSIEDRALNKLRSPRRNAHLKRFLEADPRVLSAKKGSAAPPSSINAAARHLNALGAARLWEEGGEEAPTGRAAAPSAAAAAEEGGARRARRPARRPGSPRYVGEAPLL